MYLGNVLAVTASIICNRMPGLVPRQRTICQTRPDAMIVVAEADKTALSECRHQFLASRWNCGSLPDTKHILQAAPAQLKSRETAFVHAIRSAAVTYGITIACTRGTLAGCGCDARKHQHISSPPLPPPARVLQQPRDDQSPREEQQEGGSEVQWRWGGCSVDVRYGVRFAESFVDAGDVIKQDSTALINKHNNRAGRQAVYRSQSTQCRCNGVSGSCTLQTCWRTLPAFRQVATDLYTRYRRRARRVQVIRGHRAVRPQYLALRPRLHRRRHPSQRGGTAATVRKPRRSHLVYIDRSPTYCDDDPTSGTPGTGGRTCSVTSRTGSNETTTMAPSSGSCEQLCCGRGYETTQYERRWQCNCQFHWCCVVTCQQCTQHAQRHTCRH